MKNKCKPIYLSQKDGIRYAVTSAVLFVFCVPALVYFIIVGIERHLFDYVVIIPILFCAIILFGTIDSISDIRSIRSSTNWKFVIDEAGIYYNDGKEEFSIKWTYVKKINIDCWRGNISIMEVITITGKHKRIIPVFCCVSAQRVSKLAQVYSCGKCQVNIERKYI